METRTLLTVVALLMAGVITIMLVRTDIDEIGSIFTETSGDSHDYDVRGTSNARATAANLGDSDHRTN